MDLPDHAGRVPDDGTEAPLAEDPRPPAERSTPAGSPDLTCLQLSVAAERVLRLLMDIRLGSRAAIGRRLRLHPTQVSRAVDELTGLGLVHQADERQAPVRLAPVVSALRVHATEVRSDARQRGARIEQLADSLMGRGLGAHEAWGVHHLEPQLTNVEQVDARHRVHLPRISLDAIVTPTMPWVAPLHALIGRKGQAGRRGPALRLVLSHDDVRRTAGAPAWAPPDAPTRRHEAALPVLVVVDRARAAVEVEHRGARTFGWTRDPAQVGLLSRAFDLLWDEAEGTMDA